MGVHPIIRAIIFGIVYVLGFFLPYFSSRQSWNSETYGWMGLAAVVAAFLHLIVVVIIEQCRLAPEGEAPFLVEPGLLWGAGMLVPIGFLVISDQEKYILSSTGFSTLVAASAVALIACVLRQKT